MTHSSDSVSARLAELAETTRSLRPRPGFEERVLAAVATACELDWWTQVVRFGRAGLVVGALAAVIGVASAWQSQQTSAEVSAVAYGTEEMDW